MRAIMVRLRIVVRNLLAVWGAILALLPLLVRRRPIGHRVQVAPRATRVMALPQGRGASRP